MTKPVTLEVSGKTDDGKLVIINLYEFLDRTGLPLEDAITIIRTMDCEISWENYISAALKHGNNKDRLFEKIRSALIDQDEDFKIAVNKALDYWDKALDRIINRKKKNAS